MLLLGCHIPKSYIFFTVLITAVIAYPYPEDGKTFNLKIGFDLSHGENGAPSLRIRDFEDSKEFSPRAADDEGKRDDNDDKKNDHDDAELVKKNDHHSKKVKDLRTHSVSDSSDEEDADPKDKKGSIESKEQIPAKSNKKSGSEDDGASGDSDVDVKYSTRGLRPGEFEPEEKNLGIHGKEVDEDRRRAKRAAENFKKYYNESIMKSKRKKAHYFKTRARMTSYKPY